MVLRELITPQESRQHHPTAVPSTRVELLLEELGTSKAIHWLKLLQPQPRDCCHQPGGQKLQQSGTNNSKSNL